MTRITISIPDELLTAADDLATRLCLSRSELFRQAVSRYLVKLDDDAVTEALNELHSDDPALSQLDPALGRLQRITLRSNG